MERFFNSTVCKHMVFLFTTIISSVVAIAPPPAYYQMNIKQIYKGKGEMLG